MEDLGGAPYSDYTGYVPVNGPDALSNPNRWQPLRLANGTVQVFNAPHWGLVTPFALTNPDQFRPAPPAPFGSPEYVEQAEALIRLSGRLNDRLKAIALYWADGPNTENAAWALEHQNVLRPRQCPARRQHRGVAEFISGRAIWSRVEWAGRLARWSGGRREATSEKTRNTRPRKTGGEAGIRTLGRAFRPYNGLANRRLQPLGHLTADAKCT
jgi:hypothetical protein